MPTAFARRGAIMARSARYAVVLLFAVALSGGLPLAGIAVVRDVRDALGLAAGPVYTVAEVQRQIARDPTEWVGRTVLVQGWAVVDHERVDPNTVDTLDTLIDPRAQSWLPRLLVIRGRADSLLVLLRRVPLLARVAPRPQVLQRERPAIYRVQLRLLPGHPCAACIEAVLLDAA